MSYILDALRRSEQERQVATGSGVGMLYPVMIDSGPKSRLKPLLYGCAALVIVASSAATAWWLWPKATPSVNAVNLPVKTGQSVPPVTPVAPARPRQPAMAESVATAQVKPAVEPVRKKSSSVSKESSPTTPPAAPMASPSETDTDSLKGMPKISISGYINDEQGAKLAIVNDKLLREGEEVAPGLRLESILDEHAIFSYRGQRFRR